MFIKNSNVFKCSKTKRQFLSENIENSLCTQAIFKTVFFLIVLVKKIKVPLYRNKTLLCLLWKILVYCFNPLSFSDIKFTARNFFTI